MLMSKHFRLKTGPPNVTVRLTSRFSSRDDYDNGMKPLRSNTDEDIKYGPFLETASTDHRHALQRPVYTKMF